MYAYNRFNNNYQQKETQMKITDQEQLQFQLLALNGLLGHHEMKLVHSLYLDSTPLATLKQIQLQTRYDSDDEIKILQQRAQKLNHIIRSTLDQYHCEKFVNTQSQIFQHQKQVQNLRNLLKHNQYQYYDKSSSDQSNKFVEKKVIISSKQQQIGTNNQKIQANQFHCNKINNQNFQHQNIEENKLTGKQKMNTKQTKISKNIHSIRNVDEISQLKRPEYHTKYYTMEQYLREFHEDQISNLASEKNKSHDLFNNKIQQNLSRILEQNLTPRSSSKLSVSPKVQGKSSISPINKKYISRVQGRKSYNTTQQIKSNTYPQQNNLKPFYKTKKVSQVSDTSNKQQILVKLQQSAEMRNSLDNIASIIQKNSKNYETLNSSILGIKQAISQANDSKLTTRSQVLKEEIQKIIQKSRFEHQKIVQNYTVSQEQIWQCEQQQLQEQIKRINKQLSSATLDKKHFQQTESVPQNKSQKYKPIKKQINTKQISGAKLIKVDLTPQKNIQPAKISIDISSKIQKYQTKKYPKQCIDKGQQNDSDEITCKKWEKNGKQLLTMKIANLRN